jgi:hypothetical protein
MDFMLVVALISGALAVTMTVIAWRVVRQDRLRSDARIAALAVDIHRVNREIAGDLPLRQGAPVGDLFASAEPAPRGRSFAAVLGAGALVVGSVVALVVLLTGGAHPVASDLGRPPSGAGSTATPSDSTANLHPAPLELIALGHELESDRLTVRGIVRNPPNGAGVNHMTAVVLLFNAEGGFLTSGRAEIKAQGLAPGAEAPFVITVPGATEVGRYRVSFRTEDRVLPHVDRRH